MAEPSGNQGRLVLHGDDCGMNRAITAGIILGFRAGLPTSTSVLPNTPEARAALSAWHALLCDRVG